MAENRFPTTRFIGSKAKLVDWIWDKIKEIEFDTCLDAFGGTASFSYMMKKNGKQVIFNDVLSFCHNIGIALIENDDLTISEKEYEKAITIDGAIVYPDTIQTFFEDVYFTDEENRWLDAVVTNIAGFRNKYKRAILFSALYQACLIKRPFNLFHRRNLYLRLNNVTRTFHNHKAWNRPFEFYFRHFTEEINQAIFANGRSNRALGSDVFELPAYADLVYLDPPYVTKQGGVDYLKMYHFLEGISDYSNWVDRIDFNVKSRGFKSVEEISDWSRKTKIYDLFDKLIRKFKNNVIVLSYRTGAIPSKSDIMAMFRKYEKEPQVYSTPYQYVLSPNGTNELLFVAQ
jgi:adenine-specific DNA-methyltransferase